MMGSHSIPTTERRLRVAFLVPALVAAGAERVVVDTLLELDRRRFAPTLITMVEGGDLLAEVQDRTDIELHTLGFQGVGPRDVVASGPRPFWRFRRVMSRGRYDILHSHLFQANMLALLLGRVGTTKLVVSEHTVLSDYTPARFTTRSRLLRPLYMRADRIAFVCEQGARSFRDRCGFPADKLSVIRNGAHLGRFLDAQPLEELRLELCPRRGATLFVTVARLSPAKGLEAIPPLARRLLDEGHDVQFVLAGGRSLGEEVTLDEKIRECRVEENVTLLGKRDDVPEILAVADVFLLPSRYEGLPISVIEAMAAGLPVLATRVGGTPEVVVGGETGLLSDYGDCDALVRNALELVRNPAAAAAMGAAGRERACAEFTARAMARRCEDLYWAVSQGTDTAHPDQTT